MTYPVALLNLLPFVLSCLHLRSFVLQSVPRVPSSDMTSNHQEKMVMVAIIAFSVSILEHEMMLSQGHKAASNERLCFYMV